MYSKYFLALPNTRSLRIVYYFVIFTSGKNSKLYYFTKMLTALQNEKKRAKIFDKRLFQSVETLVQCLWWGLIACKKHLFQYWQQCCSDFNKVDVQRLIFTWPEKSVKIFQIYRLPLAEISLKSLLFFLNLKEDNSFQNIWKFSFIAQYLHTSQWIWIRFSWFNGIGAGRPMVGPRRDFEIWRLLIVVLAKSYC